jgi:hypothetical protein
MAKKFLVRADNGRGNVIEYSGAFDDEAAARADMLCYIEYTTNDDCAGYNITVSPCKRGGMRSGAGRPATKRFVASGLRLSKQVNEQLKYYSECLNKSKNELANDVLHLHIDSDVVHCPGCRRPLIFAPEIQVIGETKIKCEGCGKVFPYSF